MRNPIDQMIDLANAFNGHFNVSRDINSNILVSIDYVWDGSDRGILKGISGRAKYINLACEDFMNNAKGKMLVYNPPPNYDKRKEVLCV